jgi:CRP/FNR family transcriptional regulator, dissimilatory nitrate respiration regulator
MTGGFNSSKNPRGSWEGRGGIALSAAAALCETRSVSRTPPDLQPLRQAAIIAALRKCRMFSDLPSASMEAVATGCVTRVLRKGETLFHEGAVADGFYVLQTGSVSVFRITPDGREQIICVFRAPDSFAEVTLATVETYPANAVALESSQVILVQKAPFRELLRRQPELSLQIIASMSLHLKHLVQSLHDLKGRQVEVRLAEWLLQQSPAAAAGCPAVLRLPMSKKTLAGQLGVTSETLSRTFARLRREGAIRVERDLVTITDGERLRAYASA